MYDRKLVLLVGDHPALAEEVQQLLRDHRVLMVHSSEVAREVVLGGRVDCVLLGPDLASSAGMGLARDLMTLEPRLPVALCAGIVTNSVLLDALRAGVADVVELPLNRDSLRRVIEVPPPDEVVILMEPARPADGHVHTLARRQEPVIRTEHSAPGQYSPSGANGMSGPGQQAVWSEGERPVA